MADLVDLSKLVRVKQKAPVSRTDVLRPSFSRKDPTSSNSTSPDDSDNFNFRKPSQVNNVVSLGKKDVLAEKILESEVPERMEEFRRAGYERKKKRWVGPGRYDLYGEKLITPY
ncbi:hypothetical protein HYT24_00660 [Candidatus Pacearchaeota archaeon]|nr:hypothetical protein [Candidatus Pacearchaeota archaeon]